MVILIWNFDEEEIMIRTIFPMSTEYDSNLPLVVRGIGVQNNQEHISRPSGFPYYHWAHIQKAKEFLVETPQMSIKDISEKVGYQDTSYFFTIFKSHEGITPSEFKRIHRSI